MKKEIKQNNEYRISNDECRRDKSLHDSKFSVRDSIFKVSPAGFTLLEVLVALSLLGITLVVVMQLFSLNLKSISRSEDYMTGALTAQAKMREVLSEEEMTEKVLGGVTDNGYPFEVAIIKSLSERTEELQVRVYEIIVTVTWTQGLKPKSMTLKTLKLVQKQL